MMPNEKFVTVGWQCDDAARDATACKRIFVPTLGTVTRILRPSFPPFPLAPASSESYSGPLHNLLPPRRYCVYRVKSLIAVSRRKCVVLSCAYCFKMYTLPYPRCSFCRISIFISGSFVYSYRWFSSTLSCFTSPNSTGIISFDNSALSYPRL